MEARAKAHSHFEKPLLSKFMRKNKNEKITSQVECVQGASDSYRKTWFKLGHLKAIKKKKIRLRLLPNL